MVVVLLDDTGFAQLGCYGSGIDTRTIDTLAANGLKINNFHVTPLCSPTRAALLTGRSQHAVGMRTVSNFRTGYPNQLGHIANEAATVAEVLREQGYTTFCVGKWHLAPMEQCLAAGPFPSFDTCRLRCSGKRSAIRKCPLGLPQLFSAYPLFARRLIRPTPRYVNSHTWKCLRGVNS